MGNYKEIKGNLLTMAKEGDFDLIAHGCNCFKVMGAGIALQIATQFPKAQEIDQIDKRSSIQRLGDFTTTFISNSNLIIVNLYTQYQPGPNVDYSALELSLRKISMHFKGDYKIGLPLIGCGIGAGDEKKILEIIKRVLKDYDVTIVRFSPE